MQKALEKYAHFSSTDFPSFSQYESWLGADLMIKGLQLAGPTASHAAVIKALRGISNYNGNGLLPETLNYTNNFGKDLAEVVRVVHEGREDLLRRRLEPALVRHGPARHHHRLGVATAPEGSSQSSIEMAFLGQVRTAASTFARNSSGGFSSST